MSVPSGGPPCPACVVSVFQVRHANAHMIADGDGVAALLHLWNERKKEKKHMVDIIS